MATTLKTLLALVLVVAVWWSMAALALSFDTIQAGIRDLNTTPPAEEGLLITFDHGPGVCCEDFNTALALSIWITALSAIPMALIAIVANRRMNAMSPSETRQALSRGAMFCQGASVGANLLLAYGLYSYASVAIYHPLFWILIGEALVSVTAIPVWHRLSRQVPPVNQLAF
jgi:hypothetical protein